MCSIERPSSGFVWFKKLIERHLIKYTTLRFSLTVDVASWPRSIHNLFLGYRSYWIWHNNFASSYTFDFPLCSLISTSNSSCFILMLLSFRKLDSFIRSKYIMCCNVTSLLYPFLISNYTLWLPDEDLLVLILLYSICLFIIDTRSMQACIAWCFVYKNL